MTKFNELENLKNELEIEVITVSNSKETVKDLAKEIATLDDVTKIIQQAKEIVSYDKFIKEKEKNIKALNKEIAKLEKEITTESAVKEIKDIEGLNAVDQFLQEWKEKALQSKYNNKTTEELDEEIARKKMFFINTVAEKAGEILKADLLMGKDGNINGTVLGTKGKVTVQTIYAEGVVQRLHFRVLVK